MTGRQHDFILMLLIKALLLSNPTAVHERTGPSWGYIFDKVGNGRPHGYPTIEEWMNSLDKWAASRAITVLKSLQH
jgi:hypothetical protein